MSPVLQARQHLAEVVRLWAEGDEHAREGIAAAIAELLAPGSATRSLTEAAEVALEDGAE